MNDFQSFIRHFKTSANVSKPAMERMLFRIGSMIALRAKLNAPIDQGMLRNSIDFKVEVGENEGTVTVGSWGVPYAAMQEFGGIIRATRSRFLTIPLAPWAKYRRARDFNLSFIKTPKGGILVDRTKLIRGGKIPRDAIGFILRPQVRIKGKAYMRRAIESSKASIIQILREVGE